MKICCPVCGSDFPLLAGLNDADARRFAVLMGELPPPIARLMPGYLQLFKPSKQGLRWSRLLALTQEIAAGVQAARVERHGRAWSAPLDTWREALEEMIERRDKLQLPLRNHGYLFEILAARASRAEGKDEAATEQARRHRTHAAAPAATAQPAGKLAGAALERHLDALRATKKS